MVGVWPWLSRHDTLSLLSGEMGMNEAPPQASMLKLTGPGPKAINWVRQNGLPRAGASLASRGLAASGPRLSPPGSSTSSWACLTPGTVLSPAA